MKKPKSGDILILKHKHHKEVKKLKALFGYKVDHYGVENCLMFFKSGDCQRIVSIIEKETHIEIETGDTNCYKIKKILKNKKK